MNELDIFMNIPEHASPEELEAYLSEACGEDADLRRRVGKMMEAEELLGGFMDRTERLRSTPQNESPSGEDPGTIIGNYKLLQRIGTGGFGVVYMAEQLRPVKRRVALKIIKLGMDTRQVVARFEAERQALAMMEHPNIAKVHDAGTTETGRPFFVMELVKGIPITRFCDDQCLRTEERLELFINVCGAVQHAHQKGIIHRDLKPSNVMVTLHDDRAVPKVIDFGVAKATQTELTDKTLFTQFEQFIGTPAYMSPEQAQLSGLDIDTRSDIYALGVLLYELLTGRTPFDQKQLARAGLDEIRRVIREDEPPKPSTRVATLADADRTTLAAQRRAEPRKLRNFIRGDLDWIVMKCLEKDRARRYETANGLAMDVRRMLTDEPVVAGPPGLAYRISKTIRRHRAAMGVAALVAAILTIGSVVSTWQAIEASRARDNETSARLALGEQLVQTQAARSEAEANERIIAFRLAEQHLESRQVDLGIAQLAQLVRAGGDPLFRQVVASRLVSALSQREFPRPASPVLGHGPYGLVPTAWSSDGSLVVTGGRDSDLKVWEASTGRLIREFDANGYIGDVAIDPDGRKVASGGGLGGVGENRAMVWDRISGQLLYTISHKRFVEVVEFSPDGRRLLTTADDGLARVWDGESGAPVTGWLEHGEPITTGDFRPDGRFVATGGHDGRAMLWDAETGTPVIEPLVHASAVWSVRFSPDGTRLVTGCGDGAARVWDAATGKLMTEMRHTDRVQFAQFDPQSRWVVTASLDGTARVWDAAKGTPLTEPLVHRSRVVRARFSPESSRVITASFDGTAQVWDVATGKPLGAAFGHGYQVGDARFNADGQLALTGGSGVARIWVLQAGSPSSQVFRHRPNPGWTFDHGMNTGAFRPDGRRIVTVGSDGTARIWEVESGRLVHSLDAGTCIQGVFSPDGSLVATSGPLPGARIWDADTGALKWTLVPNGVNRALFSPDGARIATLSVTGESKGILQIWDVEAGTALGEPMHHERSLRVGQWSPHDDGRWFLVGSYDGTAAIWDTSTCERIHLLGDRTAPSVTDAAWHPDGTQVVTVYADGDIRFWDARTAMLLGEVDGEAQPINDAAFSPDGRMLGTASRDGTARLWTVATRKPHGLPLRHHGSVTEVTFSPDGQRAVTCSQDGTVRVWDTHLGLALSEPLSHGAPVRSVVFSPDGTQVLATSQDAVARLWDVPPAPDDVPDWLPDWAEAVVERRLGASGATTPVPWHEVIAMKTKLSAHQEDDYFSRVARWFYADPAARPLTPFSELTRGRFVLNRLLDDTVESLRDVIHVDPENGFALVLLADRLQRDIEEATETERDLISYYTLRAAPALRKAVTTDGDDVMSWLALLSLSATEADLAPARESLERTIETVKHGESTELDMALLTTFATKARATLPPDQALALAALMADLWQVVQPDTPGTRRTLRALAADAVVADDWTLVRSTMEQLIDGVNGDAGTTEDWMKLAACHLRNGERREYELLCARMIERFGQSNHAHTIERTAKACLAVPPTPSSFYLEEAVRLARACTELPAPELDKPYMALCRAMAEYRTKNYEESLRLLAKAEAPNVYRFCRILSHPYHAMAAFHLGRPKEAMEYLKKGEAGVEILAKDVPGIQWHDRIFAELAVQEAKALTSSQTSSN